ncbi:hypothetical protein V1524DRAFT_464719 [Lipomyces starkeyi]
MLRQPEAYFEYRKEIRKSIAQPETEIPIGLPIEQTRKAAVASDEKVKPEMMNLGEKDLSESGISISEDSTEVDDIEFGTAEAEKTLEIPTIQAKHQEDCSEAAIKKYCFEKGFRIPDPESDAKDELAQDADVEKAIHLVKSATTSECELEVSSQDKLSLDSTSLFWLIAVYSIVLIPFGSFCAMFAAPNFEFPAYFNFLTALTIILLVREFQSLFVTFLICQQSSVGV